MRMKRQLALNFDVAPAEKRWDEYTYYRVVFESSRVDERSGEPFGETAIVSDELVYAWVADHLARFPQLRLVSKDIDR